MVQRKLDGWKSKSETTKSLTWKKQWIWNERKKKEQPKRKLNEQETSRNQLKRQQDQNSINHIESARSDDTPVGSLGAISNNNYDKDLENSVTTSSSTTDQQPDHFLSEPRLIRGRWKQNQIYKITDQSIFRQIKKLCKRQKENRKCRRNATNTN